MKQHRRMGRNTVNTWLWGYFFVAPVMLGITVFLIGPLFYAFYLSLTDWDGFVQANFVGFRNFGRLLLDRELYTEFFNTLKYMIGVVPCTIIIALGISNLLNQKIRGRAFFRTAFFLPMVTMATAVAAVWRWLYNSQYGLVNYLTRLFGYNPMWLGDPQYILSAVIIVAIWSGIGYASIILLAG
jgi:multiple sugar transport system permease protein